MSKKLGVVCVVAVVMLSAASMALAGAQAKVYQVTGPVLELTDAKIVLQKGDEKWEIARDASAKVTGELKVGSKVTIEYRMNATSVAVKADGK